MSVVEVCAQLAAVVGRPGSGVVVSRVDPPESIGDQVTSVPFIAEDRESQIVLGNGDTMWTHAIDLIVYVSPRRGHLEREYAKVKPLIGSVVATVHAAYLAGEFGAGVSDCVITGYRAGLRSYAGQEYHALTFAVRVKEHTTP